MPLGRLSLQASVTDGNVPSELGVCSFWTQRSLSELDKIAESSTQMQLSNHCI